MKVKVPFVMILLILVVLFTLQNTEVVNIKFFLWDLALSRALMIFLVFGVGILIGFFLGGTQKKKGKKQEKAGQLDTPEKS